MQISSGNRARNSSKNNLCNTKCNTNSNKPFHNAAYKYFKHGSNPSFSARQQNRAKPHCCRKWLDSAVFSYFIISELSFRNTRFHVEKQHFEQLCNTICNTKITDITGVFGHKKIPRSTRPGGILIQFFPFRQRSQALPAYPRSRPPYSREKSL